MGIRSCGRPEVGRKFAGATTIIAEREEKVEAYGILSTEYIVLVGS
jgi:hypothetical protein